jgi:hypothetical protein
VQSSPIQLLSDNEFDQTDYLGEALLWNWTAMGDATISSSPDLLSNIGSTVKVTRATPPPTVSSPVPDGGAVVTGPWDTADNRLWGAMGTLYGTYNGIINALPNHTVTYGDLSGTSSSGVSLIPPPGDTKKTHYIPGGISGTEFISPRSTDGRVYASARIITTEELHDDLWVQIITSTGQVVAEESVVAAANGTYEWFVGYQVGTATDLGTAIPLDPATPLSAQVIQKTATGDSWYCDNISLFEDPILWEFSTDGGATFYPVYDIRNNPSGVFVFPASGTTLQWRVTGFYPNTTISALEIRPWYEDLLSIIPPKPGLQIQGPNMQPLDEYQLVAEDPFFQLWNNPIPQEWFIAYRLSLFPPQPARGTPQTIFILPERIGPFTEAIPPDEVGSEQITSTIILPETVFLNRADVSSTIDAFFDTNF